MKPRPGAKMLAAAAVVAAHPGCHMKFVIQQIDPTCTYWAKGYQPIHRAIDAGLIRAERASEMSGQYRLYPTQPKEQ